MIMLSLCKGQHWVKKVKSLLDRLGLGNYWLSQEVNNENLLNKDYKMHFYKAGEPEYTNPPELNFFVEL